ncbi:hypothetical protein [Sutcliffiella horikoshii]|uniref:hypothetical protein n=1 Tax=Sutcliffiella horikoshii TaxID=79883 RepID=UPI001F2757E6|nr:hypothetical protein [Sutcliffiella horikoshii]MCG1020769.1 hypothetical protein [Sutcliffiella horikoshii]
MQEAFINYLPELIGGFILAFVTFLLTRINERTKWKRELETQKVKMDSEKEKLVLEYDAKLREQNLKLNHEKELMEKQHEQEIEKYQMQVKDQDVRSLISGEYDMGVLSEQLDGIEGMLGKVEKMDNLLKKRGLSNSNHPARKRKRN